MYKYYVEFAIYMYRVKIGSSKLIWVSQWDLIFITYAINGLIILFVYMHSTSCCTEVSYLL